MAEKQKQDGDAWSEFTTAAEEVTPGGGITLADIPESVQAAVNRSYESGKALRFRFPSEDVAAKFLTLCRQYATIREPRLTLRTTALDDKTSVQFRAKDYEARPRKNA